MWTRRGDPLVYPCVQYLAFINTFKKMEFRNIILRLNKFFVHFQMYKAPPFMLLLNPAAATGRPTVCAGVLCGKAALLGDTITGALTVVQYGFRLCCVVLCCVVSCSVV